MKTISRTIALLSFAACLGSAQAAHADKLQHFGVSFALGVAGEQIARSHLKAEHPVLTGAGLALVPGVIKELLDERRKGRARPEGFSTGDLAADAAGAFAGALVSNYISERLLLSVGRDAGGHRRVSLTFTKLLD